MGAGLGHRIVFADSAFSRSSISAGLGHMVVKLKVKVKVRVKAKVKVMVKGKGLWQEAFRWALSWGWPKGGLRGHVFFMLA